MRTPAAPWGDRIVGHGVLPASQFLANEKNVRIHPGVQQDALGSALHDIGFVQAVVVNKRTSPKWGASRGVETLVDGHLRVSLALSRDEEASVPVVYVDLEPEEERRVLLTMDPIGALAGTDDEKIAELTQDVLTDWPEIEEADLKAILKRERKRTRGLTHDVNACTCCQKGCSPGCGCYRDAPVHPDQKRRQTRDCEKKKTKRRGTGRP